MSPLITQAKVDHQALYLIILLYFLHDTYQDLILFAYLFISLFLHPPTLPTIIKNLVTPRKHGPCLYCSLLLSPVLRTVPGTK